MPASPLPPKERDQLATFLEGVSSDVQRLDRSNLLLRRQNVLMLMLLGLVLYIGAVNRDGVHLLVECTTPSSPTQVHECSDRADANTGRAITQIQDGIICRFSQVFAPNRPEPAECHPPAPRPLPAVEAPSDQVVWYVLGGIALAFAITYLPWGRIVWWRRS